MTKPRFTRGFGPESPDGAVGMLRMVTAELPGIVFALDRDGTILLEEGRGTRILGRPSEAVLGRSVFDVFAKVPDVCACVRRALAGEEFKATLSVNGRLLEVRYAPVRTEGPHSPVVGVIGIAQDVTEDRRVHQDLVASQMMYKTVIDTTDTGYHVIDMEGRVMDANDEYVRLTGYESLDEIRGHKVTEWTAPYDLERNQREVEKCVRLGSVRNLCIDYVDKHGRITPIEINATFIPIGASGRILTLCRDVSERRRSEEKLRQNAAMSRAVLDSMQSAIAVLDANGEIVDVNASWKRCADAKCQGELCCGARGDDYLAVCRAAVAAGGRSAQRCVDSLAAMLAGKAPQLEVEYTSGAAGEPPGNPSGKSPGERRYLMRIVALAGPPGGFVVAHIDLSLWSVSLRSSGSPDAA